ncbi:MAG: PP2C family protein-serine/threonine phosphatase [Flavobacteriales bacterium]|jgi:sigma-B regulation protein RsbU (phosphoserine phosphatase)|nr:MAG: PP2C family protein-serine/threonine phosphatase [Flavobacteriales bacterium]
MARLERIVERLELKEFQLRTLLDVSKAINNNVGRQDLLQLFERIVRDELGITRLSLYERTETWERVLSYGNRDRDPAVDAEQLFGTFTDIQTINSDIEGRLGAFDVAIPVFHRDRPLAFLLIGDIDEEEQRMSPVVKHLNFIQTLANLVAVALENRRMAERQLQQERDRRDMELAAQVQKQLIPAELPRTAALQAAAWYLPHRMIGGDYYDLIPLGDDRYLACVADVSGKGIPAALLMSNFQATLRASVPGMLDLEQLIRHLNERVFASARGERFITLFAGILDLRNRSIRYANAGHNAPLLHHGGRISTLHDGSIALGMMPALPFLRIGEAAVPAGSLLVCYTDGLVEQENAEGIAFEDAPLMRLLQESGSTSPEALNERIITAFEAHRGAQAYLDDIALLTCRIS